MVKQHKRFVQNQVQTHFSQKEKKKYPFWKIAMATFFQVPDETLATLPVFYGVGRHRLRWKIILYKFIRGKDCTALSEML
ncbi:MAG: hypothetical protein ACLTSO_11295 [Coprococcus sp.]